MIPDVSDRPIAELVSLAGRRAVVTGAAQGIGLAIARRFSEAGAAVLVSDIIEDGARKSAREIADATGGVVGAARCDVTSEVDVVALADQAEGEMGGIDIWVNNAGIYPSSLILEMDAEEFDRVLAVNLRGTFLGGREAGRRMVKAGRGGVIINMSSTAGHRGIGPGIGHYTSSKHGVRGLTAALALELGPYGVRTFALSPTLIPTPGITGQRDSHETTGLADVADATAAILPLRRVGVPDDVARIALFCASDLSLFMSGSTLPVDGGLLAV